MAMPSAVKRWTLHELHSLPDDGNKYELVRGELFVTPPPTYEVTRRCVDGYGQNAHIYTYENHPQHRR